MLLKLANGHDEEYFATGAAKYRYTAAALGDELEGRLTVVVEIEGRRTEAVVDTGADWSVCHPEVADEIDFAHVPALHDIPYDIRGHTLRGTLYLMGLCLVAQRGRSFPVEVTVFVPGPRFRDQAVTLLPRSFLGLRGGLERMRFAFDPSSEMFYFGQPG